MHRQHSSHGAASTARSKTLRRGHAVLSRGGSTHLWGQVWLQAGDVVLTLHQDLVLDEAPHSHEALQAVEHLQDKGGTATTCSTTCSSRQMLMSTVQCNAPADLHSKALFAKDAKGTPCRTRCVWQGRFQRCSQDTLSQLLAVLNTHTPSAPSREHVPTRRRSPVRAGSHQSVQAPGPATPAPRPQHRVRASCPPLCGPSPRARPCLGC